MRDLHAAAADSVCSNYLSFFLSSLGLVSLKDHYNVHRHAHTLNVFKRETSEGEEKKYIAGCWVHFGRLSTN